LVYKGWTTRNSPLLVAPHVALPFVSFLHFIFFGAPLLLFHSSTLTHNSKYTHKDKRKEEKKIKKRIKRPQKILK
jgi:hypothetical protein